VAQYVARLRILWLFMFVMNGFLILGCAIFPASTKPLTFSSEILFALCNVAAPVISFFVLPRQLAREVKATKVRLESNELVGQEDAIARIHNLVITSNTRAIAALLMPAMTAAYFATHGMRTFAFAMCAFGALLMAARFPTEASYRNALERALTP
jgi:hypothetical protein